MSVCPFEELSKGWKRLRTKAWAEALKRPCRGALPGAPPNTKAKKWW